jgi:hypothetical protein
MSKCFRDYTNDFDSVQHLKMWNIIRSVGISKNMTVNTRPTHNTKPKCKLTKTQENGSQSKNV